MMRLLPQFLHLLVVLLMLLTFLWYGHKEKH